ncbi:hypothetical protein LZ24_02550 [Desulfobotulus alkaliphilus]|uniref:Uncharacterized protein n=1 Tax=Desulfobotulus alkaliphilus TaxID=622671 RepID=A0A562RHJ2_9BACT|nr:hypothetical protein [Desulfobotulus alkaliphilus]TWI68577.1 hypothetical protein LZ24_02550 [Desulfobotulus alkaliphilus]
MNAPQTPEHKGIASLFNHSEIKQFLKNYLIFIGIVEAVIFFVSFIGQLGPESSSFPWKSYFFAAFIIPVTITFLLGIFVVGFNKYLYGQNPLYDEDAFAGDPDASQTTLRIQAFLRTVRQLPFLFILVLLGLGAGIIYKIEDIFAFIARFGEKSAQYLLISLGVLLLVGTIFAILWMVLNYKLQKKAITFRHQYKNEVVKRLGLVILEDDTVINQDGEVVTTPSCPPHQPDLLPPGIKKLKATSPPPIQLPPGTIPPPAGAHGAKTPGDSASDPGSQES